MRYMFSLPACLLLIAAQATAEPDSNVQAVESKATSDELSQPTPQVEPGEGSTQTQASSDSKSQAEALPEQVAAPPRGAARGVQMMRALDTSSLLRKGQWETGLFGITRIGLSDQLELRLHPLVAAVSPHFALRFTHGKVAGGDVSIEWGAGVPTYALRMLQGDAAGTFFPTDVEIPWMITPRAGMVWSRGDTKQTYTLRSDVTLGVAFTQPTRSVESPGEGWLDLLFAPATDGYRARLGLTYDRSLSAGLRSRTSMDLYGTGIAANPMMVLGRQVFDVCIGRGRDGRANRLSLGVAWLNSFSHQTGGARSNDFMPIIDLVF